MLVIASIRRNNAFVARGAHLFAFVNRANVCVEAALLRELSVAAVVRAHKRPQAEMHGVDVTLEEAWPGERGVAQFAEITVRRARRHRVAEFFCEGGGATRFIVAREGA